MSSDWEDAKWDLLDYSNLNDKLFILHLVINVINEIKKIKKENLLKKFNLNFINKYNKFELKSTTFIVSKSTISFQAIIKI